MTSKDRRGMIEKYFGHSAGFSNFLLKCTLVFVIGQQIYYPQTFKYFHLAILFTYMIFLEFFRGDRRDIKELYTLVASVFACSVVSIIEGIWNQSLGLLFLGSLTISVVMTGFLMMRIYKKVTSHSVEDFTEQTKEMLRKGTLFIKLLAVSIMAVLVFSTLYVIWEMIKLTIGE